MNKIRRNLPIDEQINLLKRGVVDLVSEDDLRRKLERSSATGTPLRVKLGADPTRPDLHLGHAVILRKMRQFQDLGHKVIMLIGDFTAIIGDPTGKSKTRPPLTLEETRANAHSYLEQCKLILRQEPEVLELRYNAEWLEPMGYADVIRLASRYTVARILERDDFTKRLAGGVPIALHELLYPLTQGYDSVALHADVELGGTDQLFNNLVGRALQRDYDQEPQVVMTLPLLVGLDGSEKMSKSLDNYIGLTDEAHLMFARLMKVPDTLLENYFTLLTNLSGDEIKFTIELGHRISHEVLASLIVGWLHEGIEPDVSSLSRIAPYLYYRYFSLDEFRFMNIMRFLRDFSNNLANSLSDLNNSINFAKSIGASWKDMDFKYVLDEVPKLSNYLSPLLEQIVGYSNSIGDLTLDSAISLDIQKVLEENIDIMYSKLTEIIDSDAPIEVSNLTRQVRDIIPKYLKYAEENRSFFDPFIENRMALNRYQSIARGAIPENIPSFSVPRADATAEDTYPVARLMVIAGLEASLGAARRTITGKGLKVDGQPFLEPLGALTLPEGGLVIQKGKDKFARMLPEG